MFEELMKEATEIPFTSKMRFLTEIQSWRGVPREPVLNVDTAAGLFKVAAILKAAQGDEQAALALERQAMVDPQVQQALDYQQLKNERDEALEQARQMNQQLFEAQSAQAMADQQAQMSGQQVAELEGQIQQETAARQDAQVQMVAAKDQSLQEQMAVQDQKQQMNMAAQTFQEQANMLTQQLKGIAAQPTAPPPAPQGGPAGVEGLPPPASADAAQEQQEAANAEQEAAIQGEQAAMATEEDMAQQAMAEQQAAAVPPEAAMPKQGSADAAMDRILKIAAKAPIQMESFAGGTPHQVNTDEDKLMGYARKLHAMGEISDADMAAATVSPDRQSQFLSSDAFLEPYWKNEDALGTVPLPEGLTEKDVISPRMATQIVKGAARLDPKTQGAIIGAAIGALGGAAGGAYPGLMAGKGSIESGDSPNQKGVGGAKGLAKGVAFGAASGAAGGALVGHTMASGQSKEQIGRLVGGASLILGAPVLGGLAGSTSGRTRTVKTAADISPGVKRLANVLTSTGAGAGLGTVTGGLGGLISAPEGQKLEGLKRGASVGALSGALTGGLGGVVAGPPGAGVGRGFASLGLVTGAPVVSGLLGSREGALLRRPPPMSEEYERELRQLLPEEQMPAEPVKEAEALSKCSGCGKMSKLSELGKCGMCAKHKQAAAPVPLPGWFQTRKWTVV